MKKRTDKKAYTRSLSKYTADLFDAYMDDEKFSDDEDFMCDCQLEFCYICTTNILLEYGIFSGFINTDYKKEDYKKYIREHRDFIKHYKNYNIEYLIDICDNYILVSDDWRSYFAVKYDCYNLFQHLSCLKNYEYVLRKMIDFNRFFLKYAPEHLKNDKTFVMNIVSRCSHTFKIISANLRDDKDIATIAIYDNPELFKFASVILRDDKDFVMKILHDTKQSVRIYEYLSDRLKKDSDIVIHSLVLDCYVYYYFSKELQRNECLKSVYYFYQQKNKSDLPSINVSKDILDDMLYQTSIYFYKGAWLQLYKYLEETKKIKHFTGSMRLLDTRFTFV